jgi:SNF2 family DNA or RNA helicase
MKIPYSRKPDEMTVDQWQAALRKQFASDQDFKLKKLGDHPVYSDFEVHNPASGKAYKVSIRDGINSYHYCSCPDFRVNTLGTCKHVEFVLMKLLRFKKNQKLFAQPYEQSYSSLSIYYGLKQNIRLRKSGSSLHYTGEEEFFDEEGFLLPGMIYTLEDFIRQAQGEDPSLRIYADVFDHIREHCRDRDRKKRVGELFPKGVESGIFEGLIRARLFPYQKEGVIRMLESGRVLLADEMGLGKTVQAIAATEVFARYFGVGKVLIICPTSLVFQWKSEIEKFTSREVRVVEGQVHKRKDLYTASGFYKIISYGAARNDTEYINSWGPDLVIVDEAQRIKNWNTQTAKAVKRISSGYVIVTTGTPLENRIDELHSLVEYIDIFKLGPLFRFLDRHQMTNELGKVTGYRDLRHINKTLSDILIRRTKKEVAKQLPGRVDKTFFVEMTEEQMSDHQSYYDAVARLVQRWVREGFLSEENRQKLLINLNCMRMVSDSTYILNEGTNSGNKIGELKKLIHEIMETPGNRIVIFSQWKKMFDLLIVELKKMKLDFEYLNGDVPAAKRLEMIERLRDDPTLRVFLSTDAGGVGVNLQSANVLINVDLPWNPAVLEQRIGRIYRLGQKKHIQVFNLVSKFSIEHRILYLLDFKRDVFKGVIEEEGEDQVMMEGFLQSVKTMLEVNMEEDATEPVSIKPEDEPVSMAAESPVDYPGSSESKDSTGKDAKKERNAGLRGIMGAVLRGLRNVMGRIRSLLRKR